MKHLLALLLSCKEKGVRIHTDPSGNNLKISGQVGLLSEEEKTALKMNKDDIILMLKGKEKNSYTIPQTGVQQDYVLSFSQKRIWLMSQLEEGNIAHNIFLVKELSGNLQTGQLELALKSLLNRHEILRTIFIINEEGEPRQFIRNPEDCNVEIQHSDLRNIENPDVPDLLGQCASIPFDLAKGPLIRPVLFRLAENKWIFVFVMHHIISDAWSMDVVINEMLYYYHVHGNEGTASRPDLMIHYKDYAAWQRQQLEATLTSYKSYWLEQFKGPLPVLELTTDKIRPAIKTNEGGSVISFVDQHIVEKIKFLSHKHGGTLFTGLLTAVYVLLYKYTEQEDIIIGTPVSTRSHVDLENQIGIYLNTLALRIIFSKTESYRQLLAKVSDTSMEAFKYQEYPFEALVEDLNLPYDKSRNPLFDVMVTVQQDKEGKGIAQQTPDDLIIGNYAGDVVVPNNKFDLVITFTESEDMLTTHFEYNSAIFHRETMERFASRFSFVLEQFSDQPDVSIERISLSNELEKQRMLMQVTSAGSPFPKGQCILSLFDKQVKLSPDNAAIFYEGTTFTYRTLNELSNQLSAYLRLSAHLQPGELAGINLPRTAWVVAAILGVLKAGATYLPIDHNTPAERIDYIINDSCCKLVIDEALLADFLLKQHHFDIADIPSLRSSSTPVYVIYTSGSTGNPKGVVVHNDALVNLCYWHIDAFSVNNRDRATLYAGLGFDAAVWELFPYLLTGAGLFMVPEEIRLDMEKLRAYMELHQVSIAFLPTQVAEQFMQYDHSSLRHLLVGGDKLKSFTKQKYQVTNNYGPTENTVVSTSFPVSEYLPNIPIGKPIANVNIYVVNGSNELCPVDIPGEICIAGSGLASGYLNNPELTTEKFVPNPFHHEGMLYKTGDYGRWLPSGNLEFLGRKDDQVKIRGNRVELGEIESVLNTYEGLLEVAVIATDANDFGEKELIACFVGEETVSVPVLKAFLAEKLPAYMIPGYYVQLASMPLNQNGKIDRQYLTGNTESYIGAGSVYVAPADELEKELVAIWELVLCRKEISANDDFFLLGGNSLKAMRLIGMMQRSFKIKIGLKNIFDYSVLTDQALFIRKNLQTKYLGIVPTSPNPHYPLSSSQRRLWLLSQFSDTSVAYHISDIHVYEAELDIAALTTAFSALIERHESLRTVFKEDEYGNVFQYIRLPEEVDFQISTAVLEIGNSLGDIVEKIRQRPFDLAADTLLRAGVIRISADKWVIVTVMHHIVSDGWSMEILNRELLLFYQSGISGNAYTPAALSIHYKDYAVWQQDLLNADIMAGSRTYWLNQFSGNIPVFGLHGDYHRPAIKTHNGGVVRKNINAATAKQLMRFSKERGCTLYMTLLSLVSVLLYKYTSEEDIIIGSPIAGREHESLEDQIGCYLNTLAMRMRFSGNDNFSMLLAATKKLTLDAYEHQSFPFDELVNLLPLQQDRSRSALFNVMMLLAENNVQEKPGNASLSFYQEELKVASKFDLTFSFQELGEELQLSLIYNSDIYSEGRVSAMCAHLEQLASAVLRFPEVALKDLDFLTAEEQTALMGNWPVAGAYIGDQDTVVSLFEDQEKRTPLAIALVFEEHSLSYAALNAQANRLCHYLRSEYGVLADDLVGICLERSHWSLVAMLGILKSGGAYVHIDTEYPQDRIDYMLADSGCKVLIDAQELARFLLLEGNYPSSNAMRANRSADLAYVIYTSGSTGQPKGVMISHGAILDYAHGMLSQTNVADCRSFGLVSTLSADLGNTVIYTSLLIGAALHVFSTSMLMDAGKMSSVEVDCLKIVPSHWKALQGDVNPFIPAKCLIFGGEELTSDVVAQLRAHQATLEVYNHYGPSETTIGKLLRRIDISDPGAVLSLGRPIGNNYVYLLDEYQHLVAPGVVGEICIGGSGLARGYLNQAALTDSRFIPDPYREGQLVYRTGDLGRLLNDGTIGFLGRKDDQVKIRGFRIELGEIERVLLGCDGISGAAVLARADAHGEKRLVAYVSGSSASDVGGIRTYLGRKLPDYMVPGIYVPLDHLPLTSNGKTDRKSLPEPETLGSLLQKEYTAPRNEVEEALILIWAEVLGLEAESISVKDNFFDLGGHSLKAAQLITRISRKFLIKLGIQSIFKEPTIETISEQIIFILDHNKQLENKENLVRIEI